MNVEMDDFGRDGADERGADRRSARADRLSGFDRLLDRLADYLRTRTSEHWVMFLAGLVLGSLIG